MNAQKQCIIIDDDQDDQEIFMLCLQQINRNINCLTANNGVEAIDILKSKTDYTPEFIFLDVNMPKMNGIECLKHIRQIDRLKNSRIYMYSTTSENDVVKESRNLGADEFIVKPSKASELREKLSAIFGTDPSNDKHT